MPALKTIAHGGALAAAALKYGGAKEDWLDLSTGINPVPAPLPKFEKHVWQALPDSDLSTECLRAAKEFYGIAAKSAMVAAPGVQSLIQLLPTLRPNEKVAVLGPTYGEYAHVFQQFGSATRIITSISDLAEEKVVVIVNPNNPDGRVTPPQTILDLAKTRAKPGGLVIVDEAFTDLTSELSVASYAGIEGLLVLKSFGKFFGLAGVRLGFAIGHEGDIATLSARLGPWAVSGPALTIGANCYRDAKLQAKILKSIDRNAAAQRKLLGQLKLKVIADTGLFQLVETPHASLLYETMAKQHILTRKFEDNANWLRFGLCANSAQRSRLKRALQNIDGIK